MRVCGLVGIPLCVCVCVCEAKGEEAWMCCRGRSQIARRLKYNWRWCVKENGRMWAVGGWCAVCSSQKCDLFTRSFFAALTQVLTKEMRAQVRVRMLGGYADLGRDRCFASLPTFLRLSSFPTSVRRSWKWCVPGT